MDNIKKFMHVLKRYTDDELCQVPHVEMVTMENIPDILMNTAIALGELTEVIMLRMRYTSIDDNRKNNLLDDLNEMKELGSFKYLKDISEKSIIPGYKHDTIVMDILDVVTDESITVKELTMIGNIMHHMYAPIYDNLVEKYGITCFSNDDNIYLSNCSKTMLFMTGCLSIDFESCYEDSISTDSALDDIFTGDYLYIGLEYGDREIIKNFWSANKINALSYVRHDVLKRFAILGYMFNVESVYKIDVLMPEDQADDDIPNETSDE